MPFSPERSLTQGTVRLGESERHKLSWLFHAVSEELRRSVAGWLQFHFAADREDVVQEAFWTFASLASRGRLRCLDGRRIKEIAAEDLERYVPGCRSFLYEVVRNRCRWLYRRAACRPSESPGALAGLPSRDPAPEARLLASEDCEALHHALARLPGYVRGAVALCYFGGCSYKEAAAALKVPPEAVKRRLHYGRRLLCQSLRPRAPEHPVQASPPERRGPAKRAKTPGNGRASSEGSVPRGGCHSRILENPSGSSRRYDDYVSLATARLPAPATSRPRSLG